MLVVEVDDIESLVKLDFNAIAQLDVPTTVVLGDFRDGLAPVDAVHIIADFGRNQCSGHRRGKGCVSAVHLIPFELAEQVAVKADLGVVAEGDIAVKAVLYIGNYFCVREVSFYKGVDDLCFFVTITLIVGQGET